MKLILSLVGFLVIILSESFQGRKLVAWKNTNFLLHSIAKDKIDNQNILLALPASIIDDIKLKLCITRWADELVEEGSAMKLQSIPTGVRFCFTSDLRNTLDITVSKVNDLNIAVATHVEIDATNEAIHSLINFAARNIIESISNNIGILLTSNDELEGWQHQDDKIISQDLQGATQFNEEYTHEDVLPSSKLPPVTGVSETTSSKAVSPASTQIDLDIKSISDFPTMILEIKDSEITSLALIKYIQTWSDKFAGRGTGVEADNCEDGIIFSFSLSDNLFLVVRVLSSVNINRLVSHKVMAEMKRDGKRETINGDVSADAGMSSSKLDEFVVRASKSLLKSLLQDLETIYIPTTTTTTTTTASSIPLSARHSTPSAMKDFTSTDMKLETRLTEDRSFPSTSASMSTSSTSFTAIPDTTDGGSNSLPSSPSTLIGASGSMEFNTIERSLSYFEEVNQELIANQDKISPTNSYKNPLTSSSTTTTATTTSSSSPQPKAMPVSQSNAATSRKRDFQVDMKAKELGLRLENFEGKGLEEQAAEELRTMMRSQKNNGLASYLRSLNASDILPPLSDVNGSQNITSPVASTSSENFFRAGSKISTDNMKAMLERPYIIQEDLSQPVTKLPMDFTGTELKGGYDIFQGPLTEQSGAKSIPPADSSIEREAARVAKESMPPNPLEMDSDSHKLDFLTSELLQSDEMIHENILNGFKDLLLSDNFLYLMRRQNETCFDYTTRKLYYKMTTKAAELTTELGALVRTESVRHIQTIHDICEVAVALQKNEDKFLQELDKIRPRFDTALLGYLEYAIKEEILSLNAKGIDSSLHPSTWLQVLRVVQKGVFADFEYRYERLLEPLTMVFRFEDVALQSAVFERFINITPTLDLPILRELALNILKGLDSTSKISDVDEPYDPSLIPKIHQFRADIEQYLSEEVINEKLKVIEIEAKRQGKTMERGYSNPVMQAELEARRLQERDSSFEKEGQGLVSKSILETSESSIGTRSTDEEVRTDKEDGMGENDRLGEEKNKEELVPTTRGRYLLGWG